MFIYSPHELTQNCGKSGSIELSAATAAAVATLFFAQLIYWRVSVLPLLNKFELLQTGTRNKLERRRNCVVIWRSHDCCVAHHDSTRNSGHLGSAASVGVPHVPFSAHLRWRSRCRGRWMRRRRRSPALRRRGRAVALGALRGRRSVRHFVCFTQKYQLEKMLVRDPCPRPT